MRDEGNYRVSFVAVSAAILRSARFARAAPGQPDRAAAVRLEREMRQVVLAPAAGHARPTRTATVVCGQQAIKICMEAKTRGPPLRGVFRCSPRQTRPEPSKTVPGGHSHSNEPTAFRHRPATHAFGPSSSHSSTSSHAWLRSFSTVPAGHVH